MSIAGAPRETVTIEDLLDMPDDGVHREIIRGELRETPRTMRNVRHSGAEARIARLLDAWLAQQPTPRGRIHSGEAGFRLRRNPETSVGVDVAYASAELVASHDPRHSFYDGPPVLAVEILSPSDEHEDIVEKVNIYIEVGTVAWVVDPDFRTVSIHRSGQLVHTYNEADEIADEPYLPGFRVAVSEIFGDR